MIRALLLTLALLLAGTPANAACWSGSWGTAMQGEVTTSLSSRYTVRNIVRLSLGGSTLRVRLSNVFSDGPISIARVTVAPAGAGAATTSTPRSLRFGGSGSVTIARGSAAVSDALAYPVAADTRLAVSIAVSRAPSLTTYHRSAYQTSHLGDGGDFASSVTGTEYTKTTGSWFHLSDVDVSGSPRASVVAFGDSITDGAGSTGSANRRWPDVLAGRTTLGVLNSGISSNQLLRDTTHSVSGVQRFQRDVLSRAGVRTAIVLIGVNDIRAAPTGATSAALIAGYRELISAAHASGVRVLGGTITPFGGTDRYTEALETVRAEVNAWIRGSGEFDGVVDFDAAVRDPARPTWMLSTYSRPDRLHPNDAGYQAMGEAVHLHQL